MKYKPLTLVRTTKLEFHRLEGVIDAFYSKPNPIYATNG